MLVFVLAATVAALSCTGRTLSRALENLICSRANTRRCIVWLHPYTFCNQETSPCNVASFKDACHSAHFGSRPVLTVQLWCRDKRRSVFSFWDVSQFRTNLLASCVLEATVVFTVPLWQCNCCSDAHTRRIPAQQVLYRLSNRGRGWKTLWMGLNWKDVTCRVMLICCEGCRPPG